MVKAKPDYEFCENMNDIMVIIKEAGAVFGLWTFS